MFYGGKGGVGKTTCAAARAVAEAAAGARVLAVSTDPAHSLGDALGVRLSARPSRIHAVNRRAGRMDAVELDATRAFARWLADHRAALGDVIEHGTWLDRDDVEALLDLSLPGIDELVGVLEIGRLSGARGVSRATAARLTPRAPYDLVIVDTAPTGHTLRLLASPQTVEVVADVLDALQAEHRMIREQLARVGRPDAADRLIELIAEQGREAGETLRDPARTTFCWVTLPEALSLAETEDAMGALEKSGMRAAEIIVNRVLPPRASGEAPCPVCDLRRADQQRVIARIQRRLGRGRRLRTISADLHEPRGAAALMRIGKRLVVRASRSSRRVEGSSMSAKRAGSLVVSLSNHERTTPAESLDVFRGARLLFVGGKGGVGKTTVSAAAAIRLARAHPKRRMLLLSTDPAHSVADVLNATDSTGGSIGDTPIQGAKAMPGAPANLFIRELDAARALAERRGDLERALEEIATAFGASGDTTAAAHVAVGSTSADAASQLMDLAPPGVDELFGILSVVEAGDEYDLIVVDTAPTGHALRLLELPAAARQWVQVLLRVLLKYKSLVRPGQLAAELVDVSKAIRELQAMLRDPARTRFLVVTRAAEVPRLETERLLDRLRRLKLATPALVVNAMTLAPGRCRRCRATAAEERRSLAALRRRCAARLRGCAIIQTPLSAPAPRGVRALDEWAQKWIVVNS